MISLYGQLEKITFHNEDNHYTIARLRAEQPEGLITVVGHLAGAGPGEYLTLDGKWETHPRYGQQFKFESFEITLPSSIAGIKKYLAAGFIKGIGAKTAQALVDHFAEDTLDIIEQHPGRLLEVSGIGKSKATLITEAWKSHHAARILMGFLQKHKVKPAFSAMLLKRYGTEAIDIIRENPYCIVRDIPHIGFEIADMIGRNMNFAQDDPKRIHACILHLLNQALADGHTFQYESTLVKQCVRLTRVEPDRIRDTFESMAAGAHIVIERESPPHSDPAENPGRIYLKEPYQAERGIAARLSAMLSVPLPPCSMDAEQITEEVLRQLAIKLSAIQLQALEQIFTHRIAVITGGPGTGKTTLIRSIAAIFKRLGRHPLLAAPTGRAARRLSEVTGRKAATIHKLLGYNQAEGCFEKTRDNPLEADAVIVDEASMIDTFLMYHLLEAVPVTSALILVGDIFQLPSVGPGNILSDMIHSGIITTFELKEIFRQARESAIVLTAHQVRQGRFPDVHPPPDASGLSEFYFIEQHDPHRVVGMVAELCATRIPNAFGHIDEIQVLTPMHRGEVGTIHLNQVLQDTLNPGPHGIETPGGRFKTGDKVMHLKNNYQKEVFNGDIGMIREIDKTEKHLTVDYDGREVLYDFSELEELSLAYAISVHKSQGSEYDAVIVPLMTQHFPLLQRNLLYTAITRGRELVILIGTPKALSIALDNDKPRQRLSGLADKLRSANP